MLRPLPTITIALPTVGTSANGAGNVPVWPGRYISNTISAASSICPESRNLDIDGTGVRLSRLSWDIRMIHMPNSRQVLELAGALRHDLFAAHPPVADVQQLQVIDHYTLDGVARFHSPYGSTYRVEVGT